MSSNAIDQEAVWQQAVAAGYGDPTGYIVLQGDEDKRGRVRGFMQHGEHAGDVEVDLSRMLYGEAILRPRKPGQTSYVFTEGFYRAAQHLCRLCRDHFPQQTLLELQAMLGEEGADRFLEQMGLSDPEPDVTELEFTVPKADGARTKR